MPGKENIEEIETENINEVSSIDMSDEDFLKAEPPVEDETTVNTEEADGTSTEPDSKTDVDNASDSTDGGGVKSDATDDKTESDSADDSVDTTTVDNADAASKVSEKTDTDSKSDTDINYQTEYEKVMAPFNANGVEMKPKSMEDVIRLMQMGANYHKKMVGLKPSLKVLKLLEKNQLLDPEKLNYLIDLDKKNPAAITKLLKESGMDPLDINVKEDVNYKPTSRSVSDTEIDLDSVLDSIKNTPSYGKTLNVITKVWDDASRSVVATTPHIISVINGHVADGTYDKVMGTVEYERSLGNLQGVTDLEAYKQVGDVLQRQGKLGPIPTNSGVPTKVEPIKPKTKPETDAKKQAQKKAASPTTPGKTATATSFNPLAMSDEEIEKFDERNLPAV